MKTELKTLKDLRNRPLRSGDDSKILDYLLLEKELKAEVVKWVKADTKELCDILKEELSERDLEIIDLVLSKFNDIKEEDLE